MRFTVLDKIHTLKSFYLLISSALIFNSLEAQVNTDSLKIVVEKMPPDTSKVVAMGELIYELSYGNKEEAQLLSDVAMELAISLKYDKGVSSINDLKGIIHLDMGNLDSAQSYFMSALEYHQTVGDKERIFTSYQKMGQVHLLRNSFELAKDYYDKAHKIALETGNNRLIGNAYNSLGSFFINQGWHYGDNYNDSVMVDSLFNKSVPYLKNAIEYFDLADYGKGVALAYANMAIIQMETDDLEASKANMKNSERYFERLGFKIYLVLTYNHLNKIYQKQKMYDSALYYTDKSLALAEDLGSKFDIRNAYGDYAYIYKALGDYEKYIENHTLYDDYNMRLLDEEKQATIDELEIKYKSESQKQELAIQKAENEHQKLILIIIIIVVMSLFVLISFLIRKSIREKHFKKMLIKQTEELKSINEEMSTQRDQLEQTNQKLQEVNAEQNSIMEVVAHDLRSPLNKVKGLSGILSTTKLTSEQKEINEKTAQVVEEGLELISDIVKLKEYETDFELNLELVDMHALLVDSVNNHQVYASRKNIELKLEAEGVMMITIDKIIFMRIMDNLISNAIKFSGLSSKVEISCRLDNQLIICVKDQGPGFTEEDLKHVFMRFKKLSARPTAGESSSGLGLSIVKTLVDKLGGNIEINTEIGVGSTFRLMFPIPE